MEKGIFVLIAAAVAWALAQAIKMVILICRQHGVEGLGWKTVFEMGMKSGGMPSGHTATMAAVAMFIGMEAGFSSMLFALALAMLVIVAYDAVNVRWAVGEQGKVLKELTRKRGMRIVEGHTVPQMLVGLALGIAVGAGVFALSLL